MAYGSIHRVIFKNCRLTGTSFHAMRLGNVIFNDVKANFLTFTDSKLNNFLSDKSSLESSEFHNST